MRLWAIFALFLHLFAPFLPEVLAWSVWAYSLLPPWLGTPLALLTGALFIPTFNKHTQNLIQHIWRKVPGKAHSQAWFVGLSVLAMGVFWLGRIRHLAWGDAAILVVGLSAPEPVIYNWQAPFTVFLHQRLWTYFFQPQFGWQVQQVYALVSVLCGGAFVWVLLQIAHQFGQTFLQKSLILGMVLTCGSMQLFFGYVENYTLISLGLIIFLWLGLRFLQGECALWQVSLALALTNAFHPSTVVLWPAVLYLAWLYFGRVLEKKCVMLAKNQPSPNPSLWKGDITSPPLKGTEGGLVLGSDIKLPFAIQFSKTLLHLTISPLVIGTSVLTLMTLGKHGLRAFLGDDRPGGGDHIWFVPLFEITSEYESYTMFSLAHFLDWANLHFLLSTFALVIVGGGLVWELRETKPGSVLLWPSPKSQPLIFLGLASFLYLLLTWVWNADYGIRKDWDLFSPSAFAYCLLASFLLPRLIKHESELRYLSVIILAISALHTFAWLYANTLPLTLLLGQ